MKLDTRIKELIAVGASVTANCQSCLRYHLTKARENGAEEDELAAAIAMGRMVREGAAAKMDDCAAAAMGRAAAAEERGAEQGCGCGAV